MSSFCLQVCTVGLVPVVQNVFNLRTKLPTETDLQRTELRTKPRTQRQNMRTNPRTKLRTHASKA